MTIMHKEQLEVGERCWFVGHTYDPEDSWGYQSPDDSVNVDFGDDLTRAVIEGLVVNESVTTVEIDTGAETHELLRTKVTRRPPTGISAERNPLSDSDKRKLAEKYPDAW